jgi:hypothetical protein
MTNFEKKQSRAVFISAGEKSFRMGILPGNNPYTETPYREFWQRGYKQAEDKFNGTTNKRKFVPGNKPNFIQKFGGTQKTLAKFVQSVGRGNRVVTDRPVISVGKLNLFNRKHQTQGV